jgi:hypothetical protein
MSQENRSRREFEDAIVSKAQSDPAFRQALLRNAKAAIEKEFALSLPTGVEFKTIQETDAIRYIVLPAEQTGELSEAVLTAISGGVTVNKAKTADKAFQQMSDYIKG